MEEKPPFDSFNPPPKPVAKPSSSSGVGWVIAVVLLGVTVVGTCLCLPVFVALLLPAVQAAREAARSAESSNNLKQIGLALMRYEAAHGTFPPAYIPDENGRPVTSWRTLILPFIEQQALADQYDDTKPWDDPANATVVGADISLYRSPRDGRQRPGYTNYVAITGENTVLQGGNSASISEIRDGTSNTIMVVEVVNSDIRWAEPRDLEVDSYQRVDEGADPSASNVMPHRAIVLFGDCSVHRLSPEVTAQTLREYFTRSGGEPPQSLSRP